jgi:hypothetical protein
MSTNAERIAHLKIAVATDQERGMISSIYGVAYLAALVKDYDDRGRQIDAVHEILFAASIPLDMSDQQFNAQIILRSRDALTTPKKPEATK